MTKWVEEVLVGLQLGVLGGAGSSEQGWRRSEGACVLRRLLEPQAPALSYGLAQEVPAVS